MLSQLVTPGLPSQACITIQSFARSTFKFELGLAGPGCQWQSDSKLRPPFGCAVKRASSENRSPTRQQLKTPSVVRPSPHHPHPTAMSAAGAEVRLIITPVDLNAQVESKQGLNAQNHADLLPYTLKGEELHIEREWWEQDLLQKTRDKITEAVAKQSLQLVVQDELPGDGIKERNAKQP
eukprot:2603218-Rhodomonas_salina.2